MINGYIYKNYGSLTNNLSISINKILKNLSMRMGLKLLFWLWLVGNPIKKWFGLSSVSNCIGFIWILTHVMILMGPVQLDVGLKSDRLRNCNIFMYFILDLVQLDSKLRPYRLRKYCHIFMYSIFLRKIKYQTHRKRQMGNFK